MILRFMGNTQDAPVSVPNQNLAGRKSQLGLIQLRAISLPAVLNLAEAS